MSCRIFKIIGRSVRILRKRKSLSQHAVAQRAEIDRSHLSHIENGKKNITVDTLEKIMQACDGGYPEWLSCFDLALFDRCGELIKNNECPVRKNGFCPYFGPILLTENSVFWVVDRDLRFEYLDLGNRDGTPEALLEIIPPLDAYALVNKLKNSESETNTIRIDHSTVFSKNVKATSWVVPRLRQETKGWLGHTQF